VVRRRAFDGSGPPSHRTLTFPSNPHLDLPRCCSVLQVFFCLLHSHRPMLHSLDAIFGSVKLTKSHSLSPFFCSNGREIDQGWDSIPLFFRSLTLLIFPFFELHLAIHGAAAAQGIRILTSCYCVPAAPPPCATCRHLCSPAWMR
jgi:hypothetical protein